MRRRVICAAILVVARATASAPTGAEETGISGQVDSTVELSLAHPSSDRVVATVTATIGRTQVSVVQPGHSPRRLRTFPRPIAQEQVAVRATKHGSGVTEQTITFGPQGP